MNDPQSSQSGWTVQQFADVAGKPWYALQEHGPGGVERQYTGHAHEIAELTATLGISPRPLPRIAEETFYQSLGERGRSYELGRQFAADPTQGIRQDYTPHDLDRFAAGQQVRVMEDKIRNENAVITEARTLSGYSPEQRSEIRHGNHLAARYAAPEDRPTFERTEQAFHRLEVAGRLPVVTPEQQQALIADFQRYALDLGTPTAAEALAWAEKEVGQIVSVPAERQAYTSQELAEKSAAFDQRFAGLQAAIAPLQERLRQQFPSQHEQQTEEQNSLSFGY